MICQPLIGLPCKPVPFPRNFACSVISFVTPCIVRSPTMSPLSAPVCFTLLLLKVIVGYFATSKKWSLRRSSSRLSFCVDLNRAFELLEVAVHEAEKVAHLETDRRMDGIEFVSVIGAGGQDGAAERGDQEQRQRFFHCSRQ